MFATVMESGDHGPFNSWDRQVYSHELNLDGSPNLVKMYDEIRFNYFMGNYYGTCHNNALMMFFTCAAVAHAFAVSCVCRLYVAGAVDSPLFARPLAHQAKRQWTMMTGPRTITRTTTTLPTPTRA